MAIKALFRGNSVIEVCEYELRSIRPGEIRVSIEIVAACGSDKRIYRNGSPVTPGHEIGGSVVDVGAGVSNSNLHQRGLVYMPVFCGHCECCQAGDTNVCTNLTDLIGWQLDGGYATYVDVPERCFIKIPDDIPTDSAIMALDTIGTASHALRTAMLPSRSVERIAVLGCGPLGLGAVAVCGSLDLPAPRAYDPRTLASSAAAKLGAEVRGAFSDPNEFDIVIEASGSPDARSLAHYIAKPGGIVVALGESEAPYCISATPATRRKSLWHLRTFYFPMRDVQDNWPIVRSVGEQLVDVMATHAQMQDLPRAFTDFMNGSSLKPFIHP